MPVAIKGKQYFTVAERLSLAYGGKDFTKPVGIKSVLTEIVATQPLVIVRATVTFEDGRSASGLAEAQLDAPPNSADGTNPVECAETSAVGRALAFIGYHGSDTGLAGAEEVRSAYSRREARGFRDDAAVERGFPPTPPDDDEGRQPVTATRPGAVPATPKQLETIRKMARGRSIPTDNLTRAQASEIIISLIGEMDQRGAQ